MDIERACLRASSVDIEGLSSFESNRRFVKMRGTYLIDRHTGGHLIEAERAHDIPRGYLSGVVIASQTVGSVRVIGGHYVVDMFLGLPVGARKVMEISDLMARFVAVIVMISLKEKVQFAGKGVWATKPCNQAGNILGDKEGVLKRGGFGDVGVLAVGVERRGPGAVGVAAASKADGWIDDIAIVSTSTPSWRRVRRPRERFGLPQQCQSEDSPDPPGWFGPSFQGIWRRLGSMR